MKKLLLAISILSALNYSCSKKDHIIIPSTPPPILTEYQVDLNFTINPVCRISYDDGAGYPPFKEKDFEFYASSDSNLPNDNSGTHIDVNQVYSYYYDYETTSSNIFHISIKGQQNPPTDEDGFYMQTRNNFNFFNLPYQSGIASFSDTCYVTGGNGKYSGIGQKVTPLIFSGFMDTTNHTGSIRIKGFVYLQQ